MRRTLVAPISFGLGDLVVSLPTIQALVAAGQRCGEEVWLVSRAPAQRLLAPRITGLAGCIDEGSLDINSLDINSLDIGKGDRLIDLRDHALQRDNWWGSAAFEQAFGAIDINEILDRIGTDFGIHADFTAPIPLESRARPDVAGTVLLVHETDGLDKAWPPERWAALATALAADGHEVRQVTRAGANPAMRATGIPEVLAPTPGDAVDILTACRAVIGVDTGLTHIAVQQGTPTVTICRFGSVYMRPWRHCRAARGDRCTAACLTTEAAYAYNSRVGLTEFDPGRRVCPSEESCLQQVTPQRIVALLQELL